MAKGKTYESHAVGKRKTSIARVYVANGNGKITVNKRGFEEYFPNGIHRLVIEQPLKLVNLAGKYDLTINVIGGGNTGQAGAIRLGIARVLEKLDPSLRPTLKKAGFLTRDARKVERKKYGQAGARRSFQFSKR